VICSRNFGVWADKHVFSLSILRLDFEQALLYTSSYGISIV